MGTVGNTNASKHNVHIKKLLSKAEKDLYDELYNLISDTYGLDTKPVDQLLLSVALVDYVRVIRAYAYEKKNPQEDVSDAIDRASRSMRTNLSEMGITGKYQKTETATTSLSAVLTALVQHP